MTAAPSNGLENEAKQVGINWNVAPLQAFCAGMAGYAATPLIQCSNKSSLPGLSVREVIAMTKIGESRRPNSLLLLFRSFPC